jgi:RNA polymerase sigma-70 factor (ECF subfamily)
MYLIFNEGYTASAGKALTRSELCAEAIRLARLLAQLMPDEAEVTGLLALVLLVEARRPARTGSDGSLIVLTEQDRAKWDTAMIAEGHALVRACLRRNRPGPYQLQAAINAVHDDAATAEETDWGQILALYDQLMIVEPTPVVALNRCIAVAEVHGPAAALDLLAGLELDDYHLFHATRAEMLRRLGQPAEAAAAYDAAIVRAANGAERTFLQQRRDSLTAEQGEGGLDAIAADRDDHAQDQDSAEEQPDVAEQAEQAGAGEEARSAMYSDEHHGHDAQRRTKERENGPPHQRADEPSV